MTWLGPLMPASALVNKCFEKVLPLVTGRNYLYGHSKRLAKKMARTAQKRLANKCFDLVFAPAGSVEVSQLETDLPIIYLSDTTAALMFSYYPEFSHLLARCRREADEMERKAIEKARIVLCSSSWAAQSATNDYQAEPSKVYVVPFGANLDETPPREETLKAPVGSSCRLLFVGVDWTRKGGQIAFDTMLELERGGIPTELVVVGCAPPANVRHPSLKVVPFLSKADSAQAKQLSRLYLGSHFFLFPTRNDCYGIVLCEANAHGLPAIATDTGGVSEIVRKGENGYLLPPEAGGAEYAKVIAQVWEDHEGYLRMRAASRSAYETRFNWATWGQKVQTIITTSF